MADIFLSYSSKDRDRAKALVKAFERKGWSIWWDTKIGIGKSWPEVLQEQIAASRAMVVLWSRASIKSRWVNNEARVGHQRGVLLPVLIERIDPPLEFSDIQAADLSNWSGDNEDIELSRLIHDLRALLKGSDLSAANSDKDLSKIRGMLSYGPVPLPWLPALNKPSRVEGTYKGVFTDSNKKSGAGSITISLLRPKDDLYSLVFDDYSLDDNYSLIVSVECELLFGKKKFYPSGYFNNTESTMKMSADLPRPASTALLDSGRFRKPPFFHVNCKLTYLSSLEGTYFFGYRDARKATLKLVKQ